VSVDEQVQELSARIVRAFMPEKIILFGSRARGAARPDSDIDLLVVLRHVGHRRGAAIAMRKAAAGFPVPKDIVVSTPQRLAERGTVPGTLEYFALHTGVVVYERG